MCRFAAGKAGQELCLGDALYRSWRGGYSRALEICRAAPAQQGMDTGPLHPQWALGARALENTQAAPQAWCGLGSGLEDSRRQMALGALALQITAQPGLYLPISPPSMGFPGELRIFTHHITRNNLI